MSTINSKTTPSPKLAAKTNLARTSLAIALSFGLMACGGGEHEVHAVDKVDEAAELARANAPEAEIVEFEDTKDSGDTDNTEATATIDEAEADSDTAATDETASTEVTDESTTTDVVETPDEPEQEVEQKEAVTEAAPKATETAAAATPALSANAGKELYDSTCHVCHATGLLGAPKLGDTAAWQPRIAKGIDTLHKHSAEGFKGMPAQATGDISKEQVYAAVDYIVAQSS